MEYILIVAFTTALFFRTIWFGLAPDDEQASKTAYAYKDMWAKGQMRTIHGVFSIFYGSGLFKNKKHDHAFTMFLNMVIGCLIYACFASLWASLLWLAHPVNNQVTIWMNGRRYQISIILGLISVLFPIAGIATYALALYFHPIAIPFILVPLVKSNWIALLWLVPCIGTAIRYKFWIARRFVLQPFDIYRRFEIGKISLAIRSIGEYILHMAIPRGFVMYHPRIWGVAELPGNRARNFAVDASFAGYSALILFSLVLVWLGGRSCLEHAVIGLVACIMWSGLVINPTQLWAQRYISVASLFFILAIQAGIPVKYLSHVNVCLLTWYVAITLKDMNCYRSFFDFFLMQSINDTRNQNSHYFGMVGIDNEAFRFKEDKKPLEALMASCYATAIGFHWCMYNPKPDLIHDHLGNKLRKGN